jgi:hypothetical protein
MHRVLPRAWAACVLLAAGALCAWAAEPITRSGVVLLQPSSVLEERVASLDAMAQYIQSVESAAKEGVLASPSKRPSAGFIVVAVRPGQRARVWLDFDASPNFQTSRQIVAKVGVVTPFEARNGPVVFALKVRLWDAPESRRVAPSPSEWKAATQAAGRALELDEMIEAVWRD